MKTDCFYVYNGFPVAIVADPAEKRFPHYPDPRKVEIRYIQHCDPDKEKREIVSCDELTELTEELAVKSINKLCELRDQAAGKYNVVIWAYEECMRYM